MLLFSVAKTNAAISLERVKNASACVYMLHGVFSVGAVFTAESLIEHCQVVRSVNSAMSRRAIRIRTPM